MGSQEIHLVISYSVVVKIKEKILITLYFRSRVSNTYRDREMYEVRNMKSPNSNILKDNAQYS